MIWDENLQSGKNWPSLLTLQAFLFILLFRAMLIPVTISLNYLVFTMTYALGNTDCQQQK